VNRETKKPWYERWFGISFEAPPVASVPPDGRSSIETGPIGSALGQIGSVGYVAPPFSLAMLPTLRKLRMFNPDVSQMVGNHAALANAGHKIQVETKDKSKAEAVLTRLNEAAMRLYQNGAGVDGLVNAYIGQIATFGALSSEDVIDLAAKRVEKVVLVPVEQIRFRYENGGYAPKQMAWSYFGAQQVKRTKDAIGLIDLNPLTYRYYALQTMENSPYALPLALASIKILEGPQTDALENIGSVIKKYGLLGLMTVLMKAPPQIRGESFTEYQQRLIKHQKDVAQSLDGVLSKGLMVGYDDLKVGLEAIGANARGVSEILQIVEEMGFSGMGSMPFMHGRNYSTTETFADVIYALEIAQSENIQTLVKRRQEGTYRLDLALAAIEATVDVTFNGIQSRDDYKKAQGQAIRQNVVLERVQHGMIEPDVGARECGYEKWYDPGLIHGALPTAIGAANPNLWAKSPGFSATFRFDRQSQRYRFVTSRIEIASAAAEAGDGSQVTGDRVIDVDFQKKRKAA
jgi:hypothetical protein